MLTSVKPASANGYGWLMGSRTTTTLFDDLDGTTEGVRTVTIGLDRQSVELDLSEANYQKVRDFLTPYLDASRKTSSSSAGRRGGKTVFDKQADTQVIRSWAEANGHEVSARGRIRQEVLDAYQAAHG